MLSGILWVDRTGAPWWDMPECYGKWTTAASRFSHGRANGVWDRRLAALLQQTGDLGGDAGPAPP